MPEQTLPQLTQKIQTRPSFVVAVGKSWKADYCIHLITK